MGSGRSDRAWARGARRCFSSFNHVWCAGIGQVLAPAPPNRIAQTARTSSMAARAALDRGPASSMMRISPYTIVTVALSRFAASSPLASATARSVTSITRCTGPRLPGQRAVGPDSDRRRNRERGYGTMG
jgi:hypothetical protein